MLPAFVLPNKACCLDCGGDVQSVSVCPRTSFRCLPDIPHPTPTLNCQPLNPFPLPHRHDMASTGNEPLPLWRQCGGKGGFCSLFGSCADAPFAGRRCESGLECVRQSEWYRQVGAKWECVRALDSLGVCICIAVCSRSVITEAGCSTTSVRALHPEITSHPGLSLSAAACCCLCTVAPLAC